MKVERLDVTTIYVKDLDKAMKFFSDLFETEFLEPWPTMMDTRETVDRRWGINLATPLTPDGVSSKVMASKGEGLITTGFKVPNLDEAVAEMKSRGIKLVAREKIGAGEYACFHPSDTFGAMILLVEYKEENLAAACASK